MDSDRARRRNHNVDTDSDGIHGSSFLQDSGVPLSGVPLFRHHLHAIRHPSHQDATCKFHVTFLETNNVYN